MRAIVLDGSGVRLEADRPAPGAGPGEVLVRVRRAGVCDTDLQLVVGYKGFQGVLGHEFVGVVLDRRLAGRRVVGEICSCGGCETCRTGLPGQCPERTVLGIVNRAISMDILEFRGRVLVIQASRGG